MIQNDDTFSFDCNAIGYFIYCTEYFFRVQKKKLLVNIVNI